MLWAIAESAVAWIGLAARNTKNDSARLSAQPHPTPISEAHKSAADGCSHSPAMPTKEEVKVPSTSRRWLRILAARSEERRVGKECRSRWGGGQERRERREA